MLVILQLYKNNGEWKQQQKKNVQQTLGQWLNGCDFDWLFLVVYPRPSNQLIANDIHDLNMEKTIWAKIWSWNEWSKSNVDNDA